MDIPLFAIDAFDFDSKAKPIKAWCMFKDGLRYGLPCVSKRSLLIGYDLMPLIGLRQMEKRLAGKGIVPCRCAVSLDSKSTLFAVARDGKIERDSVAWSTFCDFKTSLRSVAAYSFRSACGWIGSRHEELAHLRHLWLSLSSDCDEWQPKDLRRLRTHNRLIQECVATMREFDYSLVPVSIQPTDKRGQ